MVDVTNWPTDFEETLRGYLAAGSAPLDPDVPLTDLGLDSLGMVGLILDLETVLGFSFPEEQVTPATFYSTGSLWAAVEPHTSRAARADGC